MLGKERIMSEAKEHMQLQGFWSGEMKAGAEPAWIWQGLLAPGYTTLLTSQWKSGKTTLLSVLLARRRTGGLFAGLPLTAGKSVIVSEEPRGLWELRRRKLDFGDNLC